MNINEVHVPIDALHHIFSYSDLFTRIKIKRVCKIWSNTSFINHGYILLHKPPPRVLASIDQLYLIVNGQEKHYYSPSDDVSHNRTNDCNDKDGNRNGDDGNGTSTNQLRTKGHLPAPQIFHQRSSAPTLLTYQHQRQRHHYVNLSDVTSGKDGLNILLCKQYAPDQMALAIRFQRLDDTLNQVINLQCLDMEFIFIQMVLTGEGESTKFGTINAKKMLQVVDLTCLRHLERLSIKGCSKLKVLRVPSSLVALDASACTELREIGFNLGDDDDSNIDNGIGSSGGNIEGESRTQSAHAHVLNALNLNGCRSLSKATFFPQGFLANVEELDLTSVTNLPRDLIERGLRTARCLKNVSLRYMATDAMLHAMTTAVGNSNSSSTVSSVVRSDTTSSPSSTHAMFDSADGSACAHSLMLVDLAFSHVTDGAVEELVKKSNRLERCNLRGCKGISGACYNQVPMYLSSRQNMEGEDEEFAIDYGSDEGDTQKRKRKGDNIFFFVT
jgi:hypothetical protein